MSSSAATKKKKGIHIELKEKIQAILSSRENANNLVDILKYAESEDRPTVVAAVKSIYKIFNSFLTKKEMYMPAARKGGGDDDDDVSKTADEKYKSWLQARYADCLSTLQSLITSDWQPVKELALCTLMKLVESEAQHPLFKTNQDAHYFPKKTFMRAVDGLLSSNEDQTALISKFQEYLEFDDVRFYTMTGIQRWLQEAQRASEPCVENLFALLNLVSRSMPPPGNQAKEEEEEEELANFLSLPPSDDQDQPDAAVLKEHKKVFGKVWFGFLKLQLPVNLYKRVLLMVDSFIIPNMTSPLLLIDFLTASYNIGGAISLLALSGLFTLIHKHNLEYPDFYRKLYALLDQSVFYARHRARFFYLTDLFLTSNHLPAYLAAAFIKRLARLTLTAPAPGIILALKFITNLLIRHPNCMVLLNRPQDDTVYESDPYDGQEPDPARCRALESSLWELKTLRAHYHHRVAQLASRTVERPLPAQQIDLSPFFELTNDELIRDELGKKIKSAPMEFEKLEGGLFHSRTEAFKDWWSMEPNCT